MKEGRNRETKKNIGKGAKIMQWGEDVTSTNGVGTTG